MKIDYNREKKGPSSFTVEKNKKVARKLGIDINHAVNEEYELAVSHCLKSLNQLVLRNSQGEIIWKHEAYDYAAQEQVPDSVNPSLWLNCRALYECGIFSVVGKDIVQVRGFDLANITFIRSHTGWIVLDAGSTVEGSRAALKETEDVLGEDIHNKIRAVIISHSHGDHFGGIAGIVAPEQVGPESEGKIPVYAAGGFEQATMDEYVYAGGAMKRRGCYQVGARLNIGADGKVSVGCGLDSVPGETSYILPTYYMTEDTTKKIDGLTIDFQITNETEAVANMQNYFYDYHALWVADNCIGTLHNIYTMRGAKIRDAKLWAQALYEACYRYGEDAEVVFQGHAWPHWSTPEHPDAVKELLLSHAAAYQFTHDQSLLYMGQGDRPDEIAKKLKVPDLISRKWYLRPYYGTYDINARAIYHNYLGFYDANPVHLHPMTEVENARKFVEYVGSEEAVLEKASEDFEAGEYQYAAWAANQVVFFNPDNLQARYLCADALEQLAYQSESAICRNAYLTGALELRRGEKDSINSSEDVTAFLKGKDNQQLLDYLGMVIDGNEAEEIQKKFLLQIVSGGNELLCTDYGKETTTYFGRRVELLDAYIVQFYGGSLLKRKLDSVEKARFQKDAFKGKIAIVTVTRQGILDLICKKKDAWKQFEYRKWEDPKKNQGQEIGREQSVDSRIDYTKMWKIISGCIVNLTAYQNFNIVEP